MPFLKYCSPLAILVLVTGLLAPATSFSQDTRYVSDKLFVPMRSGAGSEYRIIHKGISSGTVITEFQRTENGEWAEVETRGGTRGWMRTQFIQTDPPAAMLLKQFEAQLAEVEAERDKMRASLSVTASEAYEAGDAAQTLRTELAATQEELMAIKRVSGAAIELDLQNRNLSEELETQRAETELLRLENIRLQERIGNNQILDGAIAVLLGVIIAFLAPRLIPKKRRADGWA